MDFDDILISIGSFGRYQQMVFIPTSLVSNFAAFFVIGSVFLQFTPDYRCAIPNYPNDTYEIQNAEHEFNVNNSIPWEMNFDKKLTRSMEYVYAPHNVTTSLNNVSKMFCHSWVYSKEDFTSTVITEYNLVDTHGKYLQAVMGFMYMAGFLVGSFLFGFLSDRFGRKPIFLLTLPLMTLMGICVAWSVDPVMYIVFRFLTGCCATAGLINFVYGMEIIGPPKRTFAAIFTMYLWSLCYLLLVLIAYFINDWRILQTVLAITPIGFILLGLYIPESPRWLLSQKRFDEAEAVLRTAAKWNGKNLPEKLFSERTLQPTQSEPFRNIFKSRILTLRFINLFFSWFVCSMAYYGLSLNTGNLGGNIFINNVVSGLVEVPAYIFCQFSLDRIGRKKVHCGSLFLAGISLLSAIGVVYGASGNWLVITCTMIGKFAVSVAFTTNYIYASELVPTIFRNTGLGISSAIARVGSMLAPVFVTIGALFPGHAEKIFSLAIFGILTFTAGMTSTTFPETMGESLPQTIEEAENLGRSKKKLNDASDINKDIELTVL